MKISDLVLNSEEVRQYERILIEEQGITVDVLMENAGKEIALFISKIEPVKHKKITVWCGPGNNGGDGLVASRYLFNRGYGDIKVYLLDSMERATPLTRKNLDLCCKEGLEVKIFTESLSKEAIEQTRGSDIIIDSLLGLGLKDEVRANYQEIIEIINESSARVVSVDIPSGVSADTGDILGIAIQADYTVTMGTLKPGLLFYPGRGLAGKIVIANLGGTVDPSHFSTKIITEALISRYLPVRKEDSHKGSFGRLLFVGGSYNYQGAPIFVSMGYFKAGGGYIYSLIPTTAASALTNWVPEVVLAGPSIKESYLTIDDLSAITDLLPKCQVMVVGPGLGREKESLQLVEKIIDNCHLPLIIDGDALLVVRENLERLKERKFSTIITPHFGEYAFITGKDCNYPDKKTIIEEVRSFTRKNNLLLLLKGNPTIMAFPDGRVFFGPVGNVSLATPGSGDVLAGILASFIAQGVSLKEAILLAVYLHGAAGETLSGEYEKRGLMARDIALEIPDLMNRLRAGEINIIKNRFLKEVADV
ncbi:MAG: Bifunctional NAD(P)H-hydrate repair enzyme Nnr [candidate division WS2 bacterium]|nr:Bifunctional NAD(P)H-hydrate repair enzyme Nnr [Candidatus Lithacetigena glycinireducens]MBT9175481.1 Bifunctional NAD(P)H-hydrate repair enzyme Nnr [Candidatus Lithacetigena glycinireducens]